MKSTIKILGLLFVALLLFSCAPVVEEEAPVNEVPEEPIDEVEEPESTVTYVEEEDMPESVTYSSDVLELIGENKDLDNYWFKVQSSKLNQYGSMISDLTKEVVIKGDKIKVIFTTPKKSEGTLYYDQIYLTESGTFATCESTGITCQGQYKKYFKIYYDFDSILYPLDLLSEVPASAEIVGTEKVSNRNTKILEYVNEMGYPEKLSIDTYYKLPLKQVIYKQVDDELVVKERNEFTILKVDSVKNADVDLPNDFEEMSN